MNFEVGNLSNSVLWEGICVCLDFSSSPATVNYGKETMIPVLDKIPDANTMSRSVDMGIWVAYQVESWRKRKENIHCRFLPPKIPVPVLVPSPFVN